MSATDHPSTPPKLEHDLSSEWPSPKPHNAPLDTWIEDLPEILCPEEEPWLRQRLEDQEDRLQQIWTTYRDDIIDEGASVLQEERDRLIEQRNQLEDLLQSALTGDELLESRKSYREIRLRVEVLSQMLQFRDRYRTTDFCGVPELVREQDELERDERRTLAIGTALLEYGDSESDTPEFHDSKEEFKKWAGEEIGRSASTAYKALKSTGCWVQPRRGVPGTESILEQAMEYAKKHPSHSQDSS